MLTEMDETQWHQLPTTFDHVGTSDPRFFDRHWFAIYDPAGTGAMQLTLGMYRNMDVADAGAVFIRGGRQYNVRSSRSLRPDFSPVVAPISVSVLEPYRRLALEITEGPHPLSGRLEWVADHPPEEEAPAFSRQRGRVVAEQKRYDQVGRVTGDLTVAGETIHLDDWWSARDHSWGVRPGMGIEEPVTARSDWEAAERKRLTTDKGRVNAWGRASDADPFLFFLLFFTCPDAAGHLLLDFQGDRLARLDGVVHSGTSEVPDVRPVDATLSLSLVPGTQRFAEAELSVTLDDGRVLTLELRALCPAIVMAGLGYSGGYDDGRGLGAWRGEAHVEWDDWDVTDTEVVVDADGTESRPLHRLQPVRVTVVGSSSAPGTGSATIVYVGAPPAPVRVRAHAVI